MVCLLSIIGCLWVWVCMYHSTSEGQRRTWRSQFSFYRVKELRLRLSGSDGKCFHQLRHLTGPGWWSFVTALPVLKIGLLFFLEAAVGLSRVTGKELQVVVGLIVVTGAWTQTHTWTELNRSPVSMCIFILTIMFWVLVICDFFCFVFEISSVAQGLALNSWFICHYPSSKCVNYRHVSPCST